MPCRCSMPERLIARWNTQWKPPSPAMWSCLRQRVPASTSLKITSIAGACSKSWWQISKAGPPRALRRAKDKNATQPSTRPPTLHRYAGAVPVWSRNGVQRIGCDGARPLWQRLHLSGSPACVSRAGNRRDVFVDEHGLSKIAAATRDFYGTLGYHRDAGCRLLPRPFACDPPLVSGGAAEFATVGSSQGCSDFLSRVVFGNPMRSPRCRNKRSAAHTATRTRHRVDAGGTGACRAGHGYGLHDFPDRRGDAFRRGTFVSLYLYGRARRVARNLPADCARAVSNDPTPGVSLAQF